MTRCGESHANCSLDSKVGNFSLAAIDASDLVVWTEAAPSVDAP